MNKRIKVIVPFPFDEKGVANRRAQLPDEMIRAGFEVEFVPVKNSCSFGDSYYDALLMDMFIFEAGLKAEEEGYDAVCIDTVSDSGLYGLRSRLTSLYSVRDRFRFIWQGFWGISFPSSPCGMNGFICTKRH